MSSVEDRGVSSSPEPCVRESAVLSETTIDDRIDASTRRYASYIHPRRCQRHAWEKVPECRMAGRDCRQC